MTDQLHQTVFFDRHVALDATIVEIGGWNMPVQYPGGIVREHLATRRQAGLFDVSHMGRFIISGADALPFLQRVQQRQRPSLHPLQRPIQGTQKSCLLLDRCPLPQLQIRGQAELLHRGPVPPYPR